MKKHIYFLSILLTMLISCSKLPKDFPDCLKSKIKDFKGKVYQYDYNGSKVYCFHHKFVGPDSGGITVYDSNCKTLSRIGGLDANQPYNIDFWNDFKKNRTNEVKIWDK